VQIIHRQLVAPGHRPAKVKEPFTPQHPAQGGSGALAAVDLLPIFVALGIKAEGSMMFWNKVYDGAMGWTSELSRVRRPFLSTRTWSPSTTGAGQPGEPTSSGWRLPS
jgi:hypothetical protein